MKTGRPISPVLILVHNKYQPEAHRADYAEH